MSDQAGRDARRCCGATGRRATQASSLLTALVVAFIIYGSLYPFHFHDAPGGADPVAALLGSWDQPPGSRGDLIANLLLYVPFGFSLAQARDGGRRRPFASLAVVTAAGAVLSAALEIAQFYVDGRVTALSDWYLNTAGALSGAMCARLFATVHTGRHLELRRGQAFSTVMLASWAGARLYPYVPTIDLHKYWSSLKPLFLYPSFDPLATYRHVAAGLAVAHLLEAVLGERYAQALVPLVLVGHLGAKILIIDQVLSLPEVVGICAAGAAWIVLQGFASWRSRARCTAGLLLVAVVLDRLEPFEFSAVPQDFGWLPFGSMVRGSLETNAQSFMQKSFLYGSVLALAVEGGIALGWIAACESLLLFATSLAEIYIPGRSTEITDSMIVILIAMAFGLASPPPGAPEVRRRARQPN